MSFLAFSFHWMCSLYVWRKFPWNAGWNSPNLVEIAPNHIACEKEHSITYSWDHRGRHAVVCDWSKVPTNQNQFVWFKSRWENCVLKHACTSYMPVWMNFPQATHHHQDGSCFCSCFSVCRLDCDGGLEHPLLSLALSHFVFWIFLQ